MLRSKDLEFSGLFVIEVLESLNSKTFSWAYKVLKNNKKQIDQNIFFIKNSLAQYTKKIFDYSRKTEFI